MTSPFYFMGGSQPFITNTGHSGISQGHFQESDLVVLLAGSDFPVVLREERESYRFIALSYVFGIMAGEAWPENTKIEELPTFTLI